MFVFVFVLFVDVVIILKVPPYVTSHQTTTYFFKFADDKNKENKNICSVFVFRHVTCLPPLSNHQDDHNLTSPSRSSLNFYKYRRDHQFIQIQSTMKSLTSVKLYKRAQQSSVQMFSHVIHVVDEITTGHRMLSPTPHGKEWLTSSFTTRL